MTLARVVELFPPTERACRGCHVFIDVAFLSLREDVLPQALYCADCSSEIDSDEHILSWIRLTTHIYELSASGAVLASLEYLGKNFWRAKPVATGKLPFHVAVARGGPQIAWSDLGVMLGRAIEPADDATRTALGGVDE